HLPQTLGKVLERAVRPHKLDVALEHRRVRVAQALDDAVDVVDGEQVHAEATQLVEHWIVANHDRTPVRDRFDDRVTESFPCGGKEDQVGGGVGVGRARGATDGDGNGRVCEESGEGAVVTVFGRPGDPQSYRPSR